MNTKLTSLLSLSITLALISPSPIGAQVKDPLLGAQVAKVLEDLGVPAAIQTSPALTTWTYEVRGGGKAEVWLHQNVVVRVDEGVRNLARMRPAPKEGVYLGQPVGQLSLRLGDAKAAHRGGVAVELQYAEGLRVRLANGRVVAIRQPGRLINLIGTWAAKEIEGMGEIGKMVVKEGGKMRFESDQGWYEGSIKVDWSTSPTRAIFQVESASVEAMEGRSSRGILKIEGDRVVLSASAPGAGEYPKSFKPSATMKWRVFELQRQKKQEKR